MLKLAIPTHFCRGTCYGQAAYGLETFDPDGNERIAHQWLALESEDRGSALTVINDRTCGFDVTAGELRLSLLRSPAHAGHPVDDVTPIVRQDRFVSRMDQGEHSFSFWINCGPAQDLRARISKEALFKNERYLALCAFPAGEGRLPLPGIRLSNPAIRLGAAKLSEEGKHLIFRLFETTGNPQEVILTIPPLALECRIELKSFELKTLAIDRTDRTLCDVDLLERPLTQPGG